MHVLACVQGISFTDFNRPPGTAVMTPGNQVFGHVTNETREVTILGRPQPATVRLHFRHSGPPKAGFGTGIGRAF